MIGVLDVILQKGEHPYNPVSFMTKLPFTQSVIIVYTT